MEADRAQRLSAGTPRLAAPDEATSRDPGAHGTDVLQAEPPTKAAGPPVGVGTGHRFGSFRVDPPPSTDSRAQRRRTRRRLSATYTLLIGLLVAGITAAVAFHGQVHRTNDQLTVVRSHLQQAIHRAHQAEANLTTVSSQAAQAATTLAAETSQLSAAQAQLAATEANVFTNGVSINDLDLCVAGVERALNQISLNDQQGAAASLNGVAAACRAAAPSP